MPRRKMLAAEEKIANKMLEMAKRRGSTVFQTVNDILEQALRADGMGLVLKEIIDKRGKLETARKMGATFAIERLLYQVVDVAHKNANRQLSQMWLESGRWYGKFFANKSEDGLEAFKEAMELLTFGTSEFALMNNKDGVSISCVGERFTSSFTEVFSKFIEGVFEALGYRSTSKEVSKGIIRLNFESSPVR